MANPWKVIYEESINGIGTGSYSSWDPVRSVYLVHKNAPPVLCPNPGCLEPHPPVYAVRGEDNVNAVLRDLFPRPQHEWFEDPEYRAFVNVYLGCEYERGPQSNSIDNDSRSKHGKRSLMIGLVARKEAAAQRHVSNSVVSESSDPGGGDSETQTELVDVFALQHAADVLTSETASKPLTNKQKFMAGKRAIAQHLGASERSVRRKTQGELVAAVRALIGPSRVAHLKTRAWVQTTKSRSLGGGSGYICSTMPSPEDHMITRIDAGQRLQRDETLPATWCEWPRPAL